MKEFLPELALLAACASTHPTVPQPRQNTIDPTPAIQLLRTLRFAGAEAKAPEILGKEPANAQANAVAAIAAYQRTMHQLVQDVLTTANPASPVQPVASPISDHRLISALGMAGTYAALGTWMWFAWYADKPKLEAWRFGGDGWFGVNTYAGGADKLGHVWSNLAMSRLGTELLRKGGWGPWSSSLISAGLCLSAFLFVEVNDGYYTEFSPADMAGIHHRPAGRDRCDPGQPPFPGGPLEPRRRPRPDRGLQPTLHHPAGHVPVSPPRQLAGHHRDPRGAFSSARRWRRLSHTAGSRKTQGQTSCWGSALDDKGRCHSLPVSRGCRVVAGRPKGRPAVGG